MTTDAPDLDPDYLALAETRLREGDFAGAEALLAPHAAADATGQTAALLGDALFLQSRYDLAAAAYRGALARVPGASGEEWRARAAHALDNDRAGVVAAIPPLAQFMAHLTPEALAAGPRHSDPEVGPPLVLPAPHGIAKLVHDAAEVIGGTLGDIGGATLESLAEAFGRGKVSDELWTNWYHRLPGVPENLNEAISIFKLAFMRKELFLHNLISTYLPGQPTRHFTGGAAGPSAWTLHARTEDGSWNWLPTDEEGRRVTGPDPRHDPMVGAAFTRFYRNVGDDKGLDATRPVEHPGTDPVNVLTISHRLLTRNGPMKEVPFLNLIAASWIQFQNHDWVSHGDPHSDDIDHIPVPPGHPARERFHVESMAVARSWPDPSRTPEEASRPPTFLNEVTHWWDGSQLYGSDRETVRRLRCDPSGTPLPDGKLALADDGLLPIDPVTGIESTGFQRNWWVGLSMLHTLFVREHNAICGMLRGAYPAMPGDEVFLKARMINAAVMTKIHTVEWTPALLPNPALYKAMRANWFGLVTDLFHHERHPKAIEEIRIRSKELGGIIGNPVGAAMKYALSEEFVAVYRLHSLLPDHLDIRTGPPGPAAQSAGVDRVSLGATRLRSARKLMARHSPPSLWASFGVAHSGQLVLHNYPSSLQSLSLPGAPLHDIAAVDLYRDRERGVPHYNQLRRELGLKPISAFDDLTPDAELVRELREVYGQSAGKDNVESIDLLVGTLSEGYRPTGFGFGETLFQVFILNASWRLIGDRFYTDDYRPEVYTPEGLAWVDEADLKTVLLRHHPELGRTGLGNVKNAFEPWDEGPLDLARHPIRQWDHSISGDPTVGERAASGE